MIQVPRYDRQQVAQQGPSGQRLEAVAPIEAFGGGQSAAQVTQAGQALVKGAQEIYIKEKQAADDTAVMAKMVELKKEKQRLQWDPNSGAMTKKGQAAFGVMEEYGGTFDKYGDELEKGLSNDEQRSMFRSLRSKERLDLDDHLGRHVFGEVQKYQDETAASAVKVERDEAILNYQDPAKVEGSLKMQDALIFDQASKNGWSPQTTQLMVQQARSDTHSAIVDRMLANGQDLEAKKYFEANKASFTSKDITGVEKSLEAGSLLGETQRKATSIMDQHGGSMKSAIDAARQIEDPKVQEETVKEIKTRFAEQDAVKRDTEERVFKGAADAVETTKQRPPANVWARLSLEQRKALDSRLDQLRRGIQPETDWTLYSDLKLMAANPATKEKFLQTDVTTYRSKLGDTEYKEIVNLHVGARNGDAKTNKLLDGYRTNQEIVNTALNQIGVDPSPKAGSDDATKVAQFRKKVDDEIIQTQQRTGKEVSTSDVQKIVENLTVESVTNRGWFFDTKKRVFELAPEDAVDFDVDQVPPKEKANIVSALKARGIAATDERILSLYKQKIQGLVNRGN